MNLKKQRKLKRNIKYFAGLYTENPVLVLGLALPFAILVSTSLKNAVALSILLCGSFIPTMVIMSIIGKHIEKWLRIVVIAFLSGGFVIATSIIVGKITPEIFDSLGIYFQITAVNSLVLIRCEQVAIKSKPHFALLDGVVHGIGFSLVVCVVSIIREVLGSGTLWGLDIGFKYKMSGVLVGFSGFIIVAFLAAFIKATKRLLSFGIYKYNQIVTGRMNLS